MAVSRPSVLISSVSFRKLVISLFAVLALHSRHVQWCLGISLFAALVLSVDMLCSVISFLEVFSMLDKSLWAFVVSLFSVLSTLAVGLWVLVVSFSAHRMWI